MLDSEPESGVSLTRDNVAGAECFKSLPQPMLVLCPFLTWVPLREFSLYVDAAQRIEFNEDQPY